MQIMDAVYEVISRTTHLEEDQMATFFEWLGWSSFTEFPRGKAVSKVKVYSDKSPK